MSTRNRLGLGVWLEAGATDLIMSEVWIGHCKACRLVISLLYDLTVRKVEVYYLGRSGAQEEEQD